MEFFFPEYALDIDFRRKIKFRDKEVKKLFPDSKRKKGEVDILVECKSKEDKNIPIYLHIDIQGYYDLNFSDRMFKYLYRIYDRFNKIPLALVIFADKYKGYHPNKFEWKYKKNKLVYEYPYVNLLDYKGKEEELTKSKNPFAKIVKAFLGELETKDNIDLKFLYGRKLIKELKELGYSKKEIVELYKTISVFLSLLQKLEEKLFSEFDKEVLRGNREMIVLPFEKKAYKRGVKDGLKKGLKEAAVNMYKEGLTVEFISKVLKLDEKTIISWLKEKGLDKN